MRLRKLVTFAMILPVLLAGIAACSATGEIDDPILRRFNWEDFINGGDIRRACGPDVVRYRMVLNADRTEQLRIYDLDAGGPTATLRTRVRQVWWSPTEIPLSAAARDVYRPAEGIAPLDRQAAGSLLAALNADLSGETTRAGAILLSEWHFWIVSGCDRGRTVFGVWTWPDADYKALRFPDIVFGHDPTGVPVHQPRTDRRLSINDYNPRRTRGGDLYLLHVREDSIVLGADYGTDRSRR